MAKKKVAKKKVTKKKVAKNKVALTTAVKNTPPEKIPHKKPVNIKEAEQVAVTPVVEQQVMETETSEIEENPVMGSVIKLNDVQDISQVAELQQQIENLMNNADIIFDGGAVERIDAASLQLLTCAFKQAGKYGSKVSWQASSDTLKKSAELLGLTEHIGLQA